MGSVSSSGHSRLLLCDPVCVFPYGHNVAAMENFRRLVGRYFDEVVSLGCDRLPIEISDSLGIQRAFQYYYNDAMPLPNSSSDPTILVTHASKVAAAKEDFRNYIHDLKVGPLDTICYPSIDFYSLLALVESIDELQAIGSPRLLIRLIGVMETASSTHYDKPMNVVLALLSRLLEAGLPIRLAAETPRYAEYLAIELNQIVAVTAHIDTRTQSPLPDGDHFTVICPGSARFDKGFLQLVDLFSTVRERDPEMRIRFRTQILPDRDLKKHMDYLIKLYSIPGTTVLPSKLSAEALASIYREADLVLLPYAQDVYRLRGSAVLIEAAMSGRHCLALEGSAFTEQMTYFGLGTTCISLDDMADKIITASQETPAARLARASQARQRFVQDLESSYEDWVV